MKKESQLQKTTLRQFLLVLVNLIVIVCVIWSQTQFFFFRGQGNMRVTGVKTFWYFTNDSNILHAVSCLAVLIWQVCTGGRKREMPYPLLIFCHVAATAVSVTLVTVLLFLGPRLGYASMFAGWTLYLHLLGPLLAIFSFLFLEEGPELKKKHTCLAAMPVFVYALFYLYYVVLRRTWPDFYGFNMHGKWYISFVVMLAAAYGLGALLRILRGLFTPTGRK